MACARILRGHGRCRTAAGFILAEPAHHRLFLRVHGPDLESDDERGPAVPWAWAVPRSRRLCDRSFHRDRWPQPMDIDPDRRSDLGGGRQRDRMDRRPVLRSRCPIRTVDHRICRVSSRAVRQLGFCRQHGRILPEGDQSGHEPAAPDAARRHAILLPGFCADNGRGVFPDPRLDGLAVGLPLARH